MLLFFRILSLLAEQDFVLIQVDKLLFYAEFLIMVQCDDFLIHEILDQLLGCFFKPFESIRVVCTSDGDVPILEEANVCFDRSPREWSGAEQAIWKWI